MFNNRKPSPALVQNKLRRGLKFSDISYKKIQLTSALFQPFLLLIIVMGTSKNYFFRYRCLRQIYLLVF